MMSVLWLTQLTHFVMLRSTVRNQVNTRSCWTKWSSTWTRGRQTCCRRTWSTFFPISLWLTVRIVHLWANKQELSYKVMNLPEIMTSFANVDVVGFYKRANLQVPYDDQQTIEYSNRTAYSAYAEWCRDDTEVGRGLSKETVDNMCLNDFAETVQPKWINSKKAESEVVDQTTKQKFRSRDVSTGHWRFTLCRTRKHLQPSTVLDTAPAIDYKFVEHGKTTTQMTFYDLSVEKRHQLYRAYYEFVMYMPWKSTPDETFLSSDVREMLDDRNRHTEIDSKHSLQRLEEFFKVYKQCYDDGKVAPPGSAWQRDNQFPYSMFLVNQHNRDIHLDRVGWTCKPHQQSAACDSGERKCENNYTAVSHHPQDKSGCIWKLEITLWQSSRFMAERTPRTLCPGIKCGITVCRSMGKSGYCRKCYQWFQDQLLMMFQISEYPAFEKFMPPDTCREIVEQKVLEC